MKKGPSGAVGKDAAAKLTPRKTALLTELKALLKNPRAAEIVANDRLHIWARVVGSVAIPCISLSDALTPKGHTSHAASMPRMHPLNQAGLSPDKYIVIETTGWALAGVNIVS